MIRLTRKVFNDLSIWMVGLGLLIGIVFPFFVSWMGIPSQLVMTPWFFLVCITAGVILAVLNISLARSVVGSRLHLLSDRMQYVTQKFRQIKMGGDVGDCNADECQVVVDSEDEIGMSARAFNSLIETLFESIETEESIKEFARLLSSQLTVDDLSNRALHQLLIHTGSSAGALIIENDGELNISASQGIHNVTGILESDHISSVFRNSERLKLTMPKNVRVEGVLTEFTPQEVLVEPVLYKDLMLGAIVLASAEPFSPLALDRLGLFSQNLALALHNALLFNRLERLAALDPLTGVYNRRFGLTRLHEEFGRTVRMEAPLGLMMIDLDHFKDVNDVYGHLTGDRVLIRLSNASKSVMREGDILVRYGGEEFLAILPGASRKDVLAIADRLRRKIAESTVANGEDVIKVTVSIGGISYPENDAANEVDLVDRADKALYMAKESGRNCVVMASGG
ncbi:GGDEF domain-containing protein [bacterium]|nr:GGDEF domain-containing protein [bacterium]